MIIIPVYQFKPNIYIYFQTTSDVWRRNIQEVFEQADPGSSLTYLDPMFRFTQRRFRRFEGTPLQVVVMSTSKTGKHGSAKVNLVGIDIFTAKKYEEGSLHFQHGSSFRLP